MNLENCVYPDVKGVGYDQFLRSAMNHDNMTGGHQLTINVNLTFPATGDEQCRHWRSSDNAQQKIGMKTTEASFISNNLREGN